MVHAVNQALLDRLDSHGNGFVTLVQGHLAAAGDGGLDLSLVRAGHTVPLHISPPGTLGEVGIRFPARRGGRVRLPVHRLHLKPGASLLLYTGGHHRSPQRRPAPVR
ncbi:hypothetical protein [Streptomyces sp. NPDC057403]|uniref:hypothetical protein n=1 Tax=Streptomyces sp. NPDC057403 TaxID=3346119 RepID=UPI0036BCA7D0